MKKLNKKYGGVLVFCGEDDYNPLEVVDWGDLRSLHFGTTAKQGEMSISDPYALTVEYERLMMMGLLFCPTPKSILILGLGGGSIPKFLWKMLPKSRFNLIERSALVIDLCYRFFAFPKSSRLAIYQEDAFTFLKATRAQYDLIFVDLFQGDGVATILKKVDFFKECKNRMKNKNSVLVLHLWRQTPEQFMLKIIDQIAKYFGRNLLILPDDSGFNYIFIIFLSENYLSYKIVQNARDFEKKTQLNFLERLSHFNFFCAEP